MPKKYLFAFFIFFISLSFFAVSQRASAAVLSRAPNNLNLVGYWPMNEGGGTQAGDFSGQQDNGTLTSSPSWVTGKYGKALSFASASSQYVTMGNAGPVNFSGNVSFSLSAWVKTTQSLSAGNYAAVAGKGFLANVRGYGFFLDGDNSSNITFQTRTNGTVVQISGGSINNGAWHHIVGTRVAGTNTTSIYVDGIFVNSTTGALTDFSSTNSFAIGGRDNSGFDYFFNGQIDDVRIYSRALSATEVLALYRSGAARLNASSATLTNGTTLANGLVGLWTMDGADTVWTSATAGTETDRSPGGTNTGTLTNMSRTTTPAQGKLGQALNFVSASTQYVSLGTGINPAAVTYSAWIKASSFPAAYNAVIVRDDGSTGKSTIYIKSNGKIAIYNNVSGGNAGYDGTGSHTLSAGIWYYVAFTYDSTSGLVGYVNGESDGTASANGTINTNVTNTRIGSDPANASREWDGVIDEARIYNRALTAAEAKQLYLLGAATANSSQNSRLTNGLVGLWSFNGADINWTSATAGTATDRSGSGNTGTLTNMSRATSPVIGKVGQALSFDGTDDYVNIANESNFDFERTNTFSASAWIYRNTNDTNDAIITKEDPGSFNFNGWWYYGLIFTDQIRVDIIGASGDTISALSTSSSVPTGGWHHVVFTYDGSSTSAGIYIYVDGVDRTGTRSGTLASSILNNQAVRIGDNASSGGTRFGGKVDEARIYNRVLSASEVKQLYDMGR